jgi:hypothetical protein
MERRKVVVRATGRDMVNLLWWLIHWGFEQAGIVTNIRSDVQSGVPSERDVYADSIS